MLLPLPDQDIWFLQVYFLHDTNLEADWQYAVMIGEIAIVIIEQQFDDWDRIITKQGDDLQRIAETYDLSNTFLLIWEEDGYQFYVFQVNPITGTSLK